jgi:hypothetical protein
MLFEIASQQLSEPVQPHAPDDMLEDIDGRFLLVDVRSAVVLLMRPGRCHANKFRKTDATK